MNCVCLLEFSVEHFVKTVDVSYRFFYHRQLPTFTITRASLHLTTVHIVLEQCLERVASVKEKQLKTVIQNDPMIGLRS